MSTKVDSSGSGLKAPGQQVVESCLTGPVRADQGCCLPFVDCQGDILQRNKVAEGNVNCCVVVCAPNPIEGAALELAVGEIADRFASSLRSYDKIYRHGRDKLLVALPHVKPEEAPNVMQRLHDIVERMPFKMPGSGLDLSVTVSLGGAMMEGSEVQELINMADRAMEAGRLSGNRTCIWSPDLA